MIFVIRDRECGNIIDEYDTLKEARLNLRMFEEMDRVDGYYTENFYEICVLTDNGYEIVE